MSTAPQPSNDTPQVLLQRHLLRPPTLLREYDKVARQCAQEQVDYPRYLLRLSELELMDRERRATERRIHQARFPLVKSLDSFDFLAIPSLNKTLVLELARCEFLARKQCDRTGLHFQLPPRDITAIRGHRHDYSACTSRRFAAQHTRRCPDR